MNNENYIKSLQNKAEDEYIGDLVFNQSQQQFVFNLRSNYNTVFISPLELPIDKPKIAIILESPHKHEFGLKLLNQHADIITSRPLNNQETRCHLIQILNTKFSNYFNCTLNKSKAYSTILVNSVQYQTSLGLENKPLRNKLWLWHWIKNGSQYFIERINQYEPVVYINMCTKGGGQGVGSNNMYNITKEDLKTYGLKFSLNKGFGVRKFKNQNQFTLQDVVEYSLEINDKITNQNYKKYNHPSTYCHKNSLPYAEVILENNINNNLIQKVEKIVSS
jgi:hypothetical protein